IFTFVVLISTSAFLVMYLFCSLAALKLAWRGDMGLQGRAPHVLLVVAMLATLYSVWTLYGAGPEAFCWSMALFAGGLPVYFWMKWDRQRISAPLRSRRQRQRS